MDNDRIAYIAKLEQKNRKLEAEVRKLKKRLKACKDVAATGYDGIVEKREVIRKDSQEAMPKWRRE